VTVVTAYVLVKANTGEADRLRAAMKEIDGVVSVDIVAGDVDFIVKVNVETPAAVKTIAAESIQEIDGVETTQTYIAMD
jgi:DNA-binding Lrp family transcriptional regulator